VDPAAAGQSEAPSTADASPAEPAGCAGGAVPSAEESLLTRSGEEGSGTGPQQADPSALPLSAHAPAHVSLEAAAPSEVLGPGDRASGSTGAGEPELPGTTPPGNTDVDSSAPAASGDDGEAPASPTCAILPAPGVSLSDFEMPSSVRSIMSSVSSYLSAPTNMDAVKADIAALAAKESAAGLVRAGGPAVNGPSPPPEPVASHVPSEDPPVPCVPCTATLYLDTLALPKRNPLGLSDAANDALQAVTAPLQPQTHDAQPQPHPGLPVAYELVGDAWQHAAGQADVRVVVLIPGEADGGFVLRDLAISLALRCPRTCCLLFDRPNTGRSGLTWEGDRSEAHMQSDYLAALLASHLVITSPVVLYGRGLGARLALLHALRYPHQVGALVLENVPAGHKAATYLSRRMYNSCVDVASIYNVDGMHYVAKESRFTATCEAVAENKVHLLRTPFDFFKLRMDTWSAPLAAGGDPIYFPALGVEQHRCHCIAAPTLVGCVTGGEGVELGLTSPQLMAALNACFVSALASSSTVAEGCDAEAWREAVIAMVTQLPQPMSAQPLRTVAAAAASTLVGATRTWARAVFGSSSSVDDEQHQPAPQTSASSDKGMASPGPGADASLATPTRTCSSSALSDMLNSASALLDSSPLSRLSPHTSSPDDAPGKQQPDLKPRRLAPHDDDHGALPQATKACVVQ
jgi:pimeloyl-ACP methyl ester carboxylesterase